MRFTSSRMGKVGQGGIAHDIWNIACISRASPELRASMRFEAFHMGKWTLEDRIRDTRPHRRETPLRESNITDAEIRQLTAGARQVLPGAVVNIGAVVTGCPCEDGPGCSDQVWLVAYRPDRTIGLLMSKFRGTWQVGPVQRWWLDYEALAGRSDDESLAEREALEERFPGCEARADAGTRAE